MQGLDLLQPPTFSSHVFTSKEAMKLVRITDTCVAIARQSASYRYIIIILGRQKAKRLLGLPVRHLSHAHNAGGPVFGSQTSGAQPLLGARILHSTSLSRLSEPFLVSFVYLE